jgi:arabinose-5-phosphate isomerase
MATTRLRASLERGVRVLEYTNTRVDVAQAERATELLLNCSGRRWFTGVGKSGLAAARMASSLTSIGLASHWVHGVEWAHGELGGVRRGDVITAVSHSGKTAELVHMLDELGRQHNTDRASSTSAASSGVALIAFTGDEGSILARRADAALTCAVPADAELAGLLPTSSVLAAHHVFNAVLEECASRVALTPEDIQRAHPGGSVAAAIRGSP